MQFPIDSVYYSIKNEWNVILLPNSSSCCSKRHTISGVWHFVIEFMNDFKFINGACGVLFSNKWLKVWMKYLSMSCLSLDIIIFIYLLNDWMNDSDAQDLAVCEWSSIVLLLILLTHTHCVKLSDSPKSIDWWRKTEYSCVLSF